MGLTCLRYLLVVKMALFHWGLRHAWSPLAYLCVWAALELQDWDQRTGTVLTAESGLNPQHQTADPSAEICR